MTPPQQQVNEKVPSLKDIAEGEIIPASIPAEADPRTEEEIEDLNQQKNNAELERFRQDTGERKRYANRVYWLVAGWVASMFAVVFCQGFGWFKSPLDTTVLSILVGGSTVSVLGILATVIVNLFKPPK